jgi:hypothetical protein
LPNFEHEPRQFAYIFKLYKYHKMRQNPWSILSGLYLQLYSG